MKNVSRWFTLASAVAVSVVAAGCGSESMGGPSDVGSSARTEEQGSAALAEAATADVAGEVELVGFVKSVAAPSFKVAGRTIVTSKATEIKRNKTKVPFGSIKVGEHVKVEGVLRADGKVQAREVKVGYKGSTPDTLPDDRRGGGHGSDDGPNHDAGDDHGGHGDDDEPGDDHGNHGSDHD